MNFSVITNSRKRPIHLDSAINSVIENSKHPNKVDFWIRYDDDDLETKAYAESFPFGEELPLRVNFLEGPRPSNLIKEVNVLAKASSGKYILIWNDDARMLTKNWDEIALSKLDDSFKDGIVFGETSDTSADKTKGFDYCSFMIISRKAVDALGFFFIEDFVTLGGDSSIQRIYESVGRVVDIKEIVIDHIFHNTVEKVMNPDQTALEYRQNSWANPVDPFTIDISKYLEKLKKSLYN